MEIREKERDAKEGKREGLRKDREVCVLEIRTQRETDVIQVASEAKERERGFKGTKLKACDFRDTSSVP